MSFMTLEEARQTLQKSILQVGDQDFPPDRLDRAIRGSFNRFLRETHVSRTTVDATTVISQVTLDVTAAPGGEDFLPGYLYAESFISSSGTDQYKEVNKSSWRQVREELQLSQTTGRPELIAWLGPSRGYLFPIPDLAYSISFPFWKPLVNWEIGTPDGSDIELNVPKQYVDDVLWWGARSYLLRGAPGHPEVEAATQAFEMLIDESKGDAISVGATFARRNRNIGNVRSTGSGFI